MNQPTEHVMRAYGGTEHLSENEYHELLASERRRTTLGVLATTTPPIELEKLASTVAARERGVDAVDTEAIELVTVDLHHKHLPKLASLEIVDYDPATARIHGF